MNVNGPIEVRFRRAAELLVEIAYAVRARTYNYCVDRVEVNDNDIHVFEGRCKEDDCTCPKRSVRRKAVAWEQLGTEVNVTRAALMRAGCENIHVILFGLINFFLVDCGIVSAVRILRVRNLKRPKHTVTMHRKVPFGPGGMIYLVEDNAMNRHCVLNVELANRAEFILDLTAAQYGWPEVQTWSDFQSDQIGPPDTREANLDPHSFEIKSFPDFRERILENFQDVIDCIQVTTVHFFSQRGGAIKDFLKGCDEEAYQSIKSKLVTDIRVAVEVLLESEYGPEERYARFGAND
ncbi:MAG: hypothetical protein Q9227_008837 [Pyrenula ochraceoflavens]